MNIQLNVQAILTQWPLWSIESEPSFVRELSGGLTNKNYLLQVGGRYLVLRINRSNTKTFDIDRQTELAVHQAAADAGISPAVIYSAPDFSYWVRDFIRGEPLSETAINKEQLTQIARLLKATHSLTINPNNALPLLDVKAKVNYYLDQAESSENARIIRRNNKDAAELTKAYITLCHMDPLPANWISDVNKRLWLIDWEYAASANPAFDVAALWLHIPEKLKPYWEMLNSHIRNTELTAAIHAIQRLETSWHLANMTKSISEL